MLKKIITFIVIAVPLISVITVFRNPILGKFLTGSARLIGKETKSEIYINGKENWMLNFLF